MSIIMSIINGVMMMRNRIRFLSFRILMMLIMRERL